MPEQHPKICVIIPASGQGVRFGLSKVDAQTPSGETFLERIVATCTDAGLESIETVRDNRCADMLSSIRLGIQRKPGCDAYLIFPVDHPYVASSTIKVLLEAFRSHPRSVIRPFCEGRRGHPIIIPGTIDLDHHGEGGLAELIRQSGLKTLDVSVDDNGILRNVNYQQDMY